MPIELGPSEVKLLLIDAAGAWVVSAGAPLQVSRPQPLGAARLQRFREICQRLKPVSFAGASR